MAASMRRRRPPQPVEDRSAFAGCTEALADMWADISGDRRRTDEYFASNAGLIADVRLQMLIYFNAYFSIGWGCVWLALYFYKYAHWRADLMSAFLNPILFFVWAVMEPLRLWFGTTGNLSERVANLAAFFLLTVFPQLFTHVQLLAAPVFLLPFEVIGGVLMLIMLIAEAVVSFTATRRLIRKSTAQFHLQHDVDAAADAPPLQLDM